MQSIYQRRQKVVLDALTIKEEDAVLFINSEVHRDKSIRYLTGFVEDSVLILCKDGRSALVVWDKTLLNSDIFATVKEEFSKYDNSTVKIIADTCISFNIKTLEVPCYLTYKEYTDFTKKLPIKVQGVEDGAYFAVTMARRIKDPYEIECIKKAASITNALIASIERGIKSKEIKTEIDAALLIEKELRERGGESTGFNTLAAGRKRSENIHASPGYTASPFATKGLSIIDFGVVYKGYTSDVTLPIVCLPLTDAQKDLVDKVSAAYNLALPYYKKGKKIKDAALAVNKFFSIHSYSMPHTLGHAIGLDIHESPRVSIKEEGKFIPAMILTLEPGLYVKGVGGVRLENDILITEGEPEVLTSSHVIYL